MYKERVVIEVPIYAIDAESGYINIHWHTGLPPVVGATVFYNMGYAS